MDLARYLVDAVVLEGRSYRDVARAHGVSKSWVAKLVARYRAGGYDAIAPTSKASHRVVNNSSVELEERVVRLRKELTEQGFDAGAHAQAQVKAACVVLFTFCHPTKNPRADETRRTLMTTDDKWLPTDNKSVASALSLAAPRTTLSELIAGVRNLAGSRYFDRTRRDIILALSRS